MSQENLQIVRGVWEAVKRGDLEPGFAIMTPDVELDLTSGGRMDADIYRSPDAARRASETWASPWESMVMEAKEFIDVDEDQLIVCFQARGHSKQTGLHFELDRYWVYAMRDTQVVRIREYETRQQALKAVGLAE